jgi:glutaminyl-tRNA synthetase
MSKRKLQELVILKLVKGWDDPRMPTLSGLRRRGFTPLSIHNFIRSIGYTKFEAINDVALLEHAVRDDLNIKAPRVFAVLDPVRLVITNYPEEKVEVLDIINNPEDESMGSRKVPFSRELYIERDDFMEDPPGKFFRLAPGREVRLKGAYIIKCTDYRKDESTGEVIEIICTYDPDTRSGGPAANRKVKGTLHWVSADHSIDAEVRLYDRLFNHEDPAGQKDHDFKEFLNPDSLKIIRGCKLEYSLADIKPLDKFQFQRLGYFCVDKDSMPGNIIFNRTVPLRDTWGKVSKK